MANFFTQRWRLSSRGRRGYYAELLRRRTTTRIVSSSLFSEFSERSCLNENVKASFTQHSLNSLAFNFLKRLRSVRNTDTPNVATQRDQLATLVLKYSWCIHMLSIYLIGQFVLSTRPHLVVHQKAFTTALESRPLNDLSPFVMFKTAQNHVETFHQILPEAQRNDSCLFICKGNELKIFR